MQEETLAPDVEVLGPEDEEQALVPIQSRALSPQARVALAEQEAEAFKRMRRQIAAVTEPIHWHKFGASLYLTRAGCDAVRQVLGISWQIIGDPTCISREITDTESPFCGQTDMTFYVMVRATCGGRTIEEIGVRSLSDLFFSGNGKDAQGKQRHKRLASIDMGHVMKAAATNAYGRVVRSIAGLNAFTPNMLQEAGLDTQQVGTIAMDTARPADDQQKNELYSLLAPITTNPKEAEQLVIEAAKHWRDGSLKTPQSFDHLVGRETWLNPTKRRLKDLVKAEPQSYKEAIEWLEQERGDGS